MKLTKGTIGILVLALFVALASASYAQTLQVLTAGSSAQFGPFAEAAWALATASSTTAYHYTAKSGSCTNTTGTNPSSGTTTNGFGLQGTGSTCYAYLFDQRNSSSANIPPEPGNLWVVWSSNGIWAYLSVDSTVGVRAFQAYPRALLEIGSSAPASGSSAYNSYFDGNADTALTTTVSTALNGVAITAANTDIRPEDALFATNRSLNTLEYATSAGSLIGNAIQSAFSSGVAHPVSFALSGTDPISSESIPSSHAFVTIPVGAAPVIFLANAASSSVTASAANITTTNAGKLFSGTNCDSSMLNGSTGALPAGTAINPILREPLSGTMNTVQYSVFWPSYDQESGINDNYQAPPYSNSTGSINPLAYPCTTGGGYRYRAIGTGDEVKAVDGAETVSSGLHGAGSAVANAVGYAFFSYEATAPSTTYPYHYLTVTTSANSNVDPLAYTTSSGTTSTYSGALPSCATNSSGVYNCPIVPGGSFLTLRTGTYPAWSLYRVVTDSIGQTNAQTLASEAQKLVNSAIPDFVPFTPVCKLTASGKDEPGLDVYREHFTLTGIATSADDGPLNASVNCTIGGAHTLKYYTLGGTDSTGANTEVGGDVGGTIEGPFNSTTGQPTVPGPTTTSNH